MELIGQQIDQYRIEDYIARGGMADVYLAQDVRLQRKVALKVLLADLTQQPDFITRFEREARAVARLEHPNIIQIYTAGLTPNNQPYLAMQYIEGGSLQQWLEQLARRQQRLQVKDTLLLARQVATALQTAHEAGIVHRDVKPSNILLRANGVPVLTDLGVAAIQSEETQLTKVDQILGTPNYMSPEQALGEAVDHRTDIYALGVILYEMLAGQAPFSGESPLTILHQQAYEAPPPLQQARPDLTAVTYDIVDSALRKDPAERPQTAAAMAAALDRALAAETGTAVASEAPPTVMEPQPALPQPVEPQPEPPRPKKRSWWVYGLVLVPVVVLLLGWGIFLLLRPLLAAEDPPVLVVPTPAASATADSESAPTLVPPRNTADVSAVRLAEAPTIDGEFSDWPELVPFASAHQVYAHESWDGSEDVTAVWRLGWDEEHLYLGVTIIDDTHVQTRSDNQIFRGDSLDVQIDTSSADDGQRALSPDDFQIIFSAGDFGDVLPTVFLFTGSEAGRSTQVIRHNITHRAQQTDEGYRLEAAVPWQDLNVEPRAGFTLGIALNVTDNDTPGTAVQEVFLSSVSTRTFGDPNTWGTLTLQ